MDLVFATVVLLAIASSANSWLLEGIEDAEVRAVSMRLGEERAARLLLRSDLDAVLLKIAQIERTMNGEGARQSTPKTKEPVAFTARLAAHTMLDSLKVAVFDRVLHNHGNGYNPVTGIFTSPVGGTYIFSLAALTVNKNNYVHLQLMVNDREVGRLFCGDSKSDWGDHGSVTVTLSLQENDQVFVREMLNHSGRLHGDNYTTFTGALIS